jgi:predicted metal-dependent hydrolase
MLTINYETIRVKKRRTIGIVVNPEGHITVRAPEGLSEEMIEKKIRRRASWIIKQQSLFKSLEEEISEIHYDTGETHIYLGKEYIMHIKEGKKNNVYFRDHLFYIELSNINSYTSLKEKHDAIEQLLDVWYKERAKIKFAEIAESVIQSLKKYNVEPSSIYVQKMEKRWATSTPNGKIILNVDLIKTPKQCIEYVITHELCHLLHKTHTATFYNLLTSIMPEWKEWKRKLEEVLFCET